MSTPASSTRSIVSEPKAPETTVGTVGPPKDSEHEGIPGPTSCGSGWSALAVVFCWLNSWQAISPIETWLGLLAVVRAGGYPIYREH